MKKTQEEEDEQALAGGKKTKENEWRSGKLKKKDGN